MATIAFDNPPSLHSTSGRYNHTALVTPAPGEAVRWQQAQIRSREEAAAMLSKVCAYFDAHEPSHPAPYPIRRAQQLIPMDFHDILRNLAPQGLEQFEAWLPRPAGERPGA